MNKLRTYIIDFSINSADMQNSYSYCIINGKDRRQVLKIFKDEFYNCIIKSINEIKNKPGVQFSTDVSILQKMS